MTGSESEKGLARGVLILATVAAVVAAAFVAGGVLLSRLTDPEAVSNRAESALGIPVSVGEVRVSPLEFRAVLEDVALGRSTRVGFASVCFDPSSIISRSWEIRSVALSEPVWTVPASTGEMEGFANGLLLPVWLADRADHVTIVDGLLIGPDGVTRLGSGLRGRFARLSEEASSRRIEAELGGSFAKYGDVTARGVYSTFDKSDSAVVEDLRLSFAGRDFRGAANVVWSASSRVRVEVFSSEFYDGSVRLCADIEGGAQGPALSSHVELINCDGAGLLREKFGLELLTGGLLSAEVDLDGDPVALLSDGLRGVEVECKLEVSGAVLSATGPLAEVLPLAAAGGGRVVERASARLAVSGAGVIIRDMRLDSEGVTWSLRGRVKYDRSMSGVVVGRLPVEIIGGEGTILALAGALLADRDGRIPAAFAVSGSLDDPRVHFDLERTADEAAASGRPQAKQLLKAMSRSDVEKLSREVDEILGGLKLP